jgi:hypothetical protein
MKMKHLAVVAACALALTVGTANATVYTVSGTFSDGSVLSGTLDITPPGVPYPNPAFPYDNGDFRVTDGAFPGLYAANFSAGFRYTEPETLRMTGSPGYSPAQAALDLVFTLTTIISGTIGWPLECVDYP